MATMTVTLALLFLQIISATAQDSTNLQILGTVVYVLPGDHTPLMSPSGPSLTPLGAQQLYNAGLTFRNHYVVPTTDPSAISDTGILDISPYQMSANNLDIWSTDDQYIMASAQAFMQGLYPPLEDSFNYTYISGQSELANGTNVIAPLSGYQYPLINTVSTLDLNSIWISGYDDCPMQLASITEYFGSSEYFAIQDSSAAFYAELEPTLLDGVFPNASIGYYNAYPIWDYLNYAFVHNVTASQFITDDDLAEAQSLATDWMLALYGNTTASGSTPGDGIRVIGGRTLASRVLQAIYTNINTLGESYKMTLLFGGMETMMSFAALAQLSLAPDSQLNGLPQPGSSMVFELFSLYVDDNVNYPDVSDLYVRFLFQNGTTSGSELIGYPLFGRDDSQIIMTLEDFATGMDNLMISIQEWCTTCSSYSVFCPAFEDNQSGSTSTGTSGGASGGSSSLHPAIAGLIGAVIALVVIAILLAAAMLLGGLRMYRNKTTRRSDLSGFKGAEKLASDQDLTIPKGGAGVSVESAGAATPRGHERVGSWELRDQAKAEEGQMPTMVPAFVARRPSYEDDELHVTPYASPVKPQDHI